MVLKSLQEGAVATLSFPLGGRNLRWDAKHTRTMLYWLSVYLVVDAPHIAWILML